MWVKLNPFIQYGIFEYFDIGTIGSVLNNNIDTWSISICVISYDSSFKKQPKTVSIRHCENLKKVQMEDILILPLHLYVDAKRIKYHCSDKQDHL